MRNEDLAQRGARLRAAREGQGRSLREVARQAKIDHARLSRIERGLERPPVDLLLRLARVLGLKELRRAIELYWPDGDGE